MSKTINKEMKMAIINEHKRKGASTGTERFDDTDNNVETGPTMDSVFNSDTDKGMIGLGTFSEFNLISGFEDSLVINEFIEGAVEGIKNTKQNIEILRFDKETFKLGFSFIVFAKELSGVVYYYPVLLEKTGRPPLSAVTILDELNIKSSIAVFVTADAFSDEIFDLIERHLDKRFPNTNIKALDGVVVPHKCNHKETGITVAKLGHDQLITKFAIANGKSSELTIKGINKLIGGDRQRGRGDVMLKLDYHTGSTVGILGNPIRNDFTIGSEIIINGAIRSFHGGDGGRAICTATGYLEMVVSQELDYITRMEVKKASPMIILNNFISVAPTLNYVLLAIINSTTLSNRSNLRQLFIHKDIAALNYFFNYGGESTKPGPVLSFNDSEATPEMIDDLLRKHVNPDPIYAIEVEANGPSYTALAMFAGLADGGTYGRATQGILQASSELVGEPMNSTSITAVAPITIPLGEMVDREGNVIDLREIDEAFVIKNSQDPSLAMDWVFSNAPRDVCLAETGKDPYVLKLEVIAKIGNTQGTEPIITGKAHRIILDAGWLDELVEKASAAGYVPKTDGTQVYTGSNSLQALSNVYSSAYVGDHGLGIHNSTMNVNMPNMHTGRFRY